MNSYLSDKLKVISFLSMLLVVFLHSYNLAVRLKSGVVAVTDRGYNFFIQEFLSQGMGRIAVPLFFAISGYLFYLNMAGTALEFKEKIRKRIHTLLIPFLCWSFWSLLICYLFQLLPPPRIFFASNLVRDFTTAQFLSTLFVHPIAYQLWFLRDLMILVLLSPVIFWLIKTFRIWPLILFLGLWFGQIDLNLLSNEALLFFTFGAFLAIHHPELLLKKIKRKSSIFWFLLWCSLITAKLLWRYDNLPESGWYIVLHKLGILGGMLAIWGIYDSWLQQKTEKLLPLATFSFFIYAFHEPVLLLLKPALFTLLGKGAVKSLLVYVFAPLISIIFGIFVAAQFRRRFPSFYGLITGGR